MKVLIFGASSKIAESISRILYTQSKVEIFLVSREKLFTGSHTRFHFLSGNLHDMAFLRRTIYEIEPDYIINCVAMTDVDACESSRKDASDINISFNNNIISFCRIKDIHYIYFSTDYLFDGKKGKYSENAIPNPINNYGRTKHIAENSVRIGLNKFSVIRTACVFGTSSFGKSNFIQKLIDNLKEGKEFGVVDGLWTTPTYTDDIAFTVLTIIFSGKIGVFHTAGKTYINRLQIALETARVFGLDQSLIRPINYSELRTLARRPEKAGLNVENTEKVLDLKYPDLTYSLIAYKHALRDGSAFYSNYLL